MLWRILPVTLIFCLVGLLVVYNKQITAYSNVYLLQRDARRAMDAGDWNAAIRAYEKGLREQPGSIPVAMALANLYLEHDQPRKAESLYKKVLEHEPVNLEARLGYAGSMMDDPGRYNEAAAQYWECLRRHKGDPKTLSALGDVFSKAAANPAETRPEMRKWLNEWAIYYYRVALKNNPKMFQTRFNLGVAYQQVGMSERAASQFCNAVILAPESYESRYNLGLALVSMSAYEPGYRQLSRAVQFLADEGRMEEARRLAEQVQNVKNSVYMSEEKATLNSEAAIPPSLNPLCLTEPDDVKSGKAPE